MKVFETAAVRNIALLGHAHCGKTSLASAMLYVAGATDRLTDTSSGNTPTDFDEEEIARRHSISTSLAAFTWNNAKINLFDTPGAPLFASDMRANLIAADSACLLVDGLSGVEVTTERAWQYTEEFGQPLCLVVSRLDRDRASFDETVTGARAAFGRGVAPVYLPIMGDKGFSGVIDLIRMRAWCYPASASGRGTVTDIPGAYHEQASSAHEALVELIAEGNDELMEEFFATGTLPVEHIVSGLQQAVGERRIIPVLCTSCALNIGADQLLDFIVEIMPSPFNIPLQSAKRPQTRIANSTGLFVFKTMVDPFAGRLSYFKVMSAKAQNDAVLQNLRTGAPEKMAHLSVPFGKALQPVTTLHTGDIGVVAKLKQTLTGDTLNESASGEKFEALPTPEPGLAYAISSKSHHDEERLSTALHKMMEEDLALRFYRDSQTMEFLLAGNGQQHLEIVVSRLKRRYGVDVELHAPKIPYRETIRATSKAQGRHKKQSGGHGQFGDCWITIEPLPRGDGFVFANEIFGGAVPKQYIPAIEKGICEAAQQGHLAGHPVVDFKATLTDGSYHDVDSSEMAFKVAGRKAFRAAMQQARPSLLEPVMRVDIHTPVVFAGDLLSDLNGRRGRIAGMDVDGDKQIIHALVPMADMLSYQTDLTSHTQGKASFHMEFDHYDIVPQQQADKIIASTKHVHAASDDED